MRMALLKDLQCYRVELSDFRGQFALGVVLTMQQRRTNAEGQMQYSLAIRNRDVEICPIGSLAFYVFELFLVSIHTYAIIRTDNIETLTIFYYILYFFIGPTLSS